MKKVLKGICLIGLILLINGCASKNDRYKDFQKSPCACFEIYKNDKGMNNV
ncbi:hypothetical protein N3114_12690 (plasmid) [Aliarcobacter butzleri]|uniref:hypothetical protein n=1 Tax=Aliarcobacter butzleri TaxID=28197 RepID=UPI0021B21087|nr:hypothetical protein [Aliarcobacter butzleri]UXC30747.1 hypothetical protein N3114_12690 [Aliarcobacter butzleri]